MAHSNTSYASNAFKYYTENIDLKYTKNKLALSKFNILYLNINSILNKLDELEIEIENVLRNSGNLIHVIALTEIRIHDHMTQYFNIPGYTAFFCTRADGYGGCGVFVHDSICCSLVSKQSTQNIEILTLNLIEMSLLLSIVYKQPTVKDEIFLREFDALIYNKKNMIIIGDMNLNLLENTPTVKKYTDSLIANGFVLLNQLDISSATRSAARTRNGETFHSNTIIDHFITDCISYSYELSLTDTPISDHRVLMLSLDNKKSCKAKTPSNFYVSSKVDFLNYNKDIEQLLLTQNINSFDELIHGFSECKTKHTKTSIKSKTTNSLKPWISNDLINLMKDRQRYFILRKKSPTNEYLNSKYTQICDEIKMRRFNARVKYNSMAISKCLGNIKLVWKQMNEIFFNKKQTANRIIALQINETSVSNDSLVIANTLNHFFKDIGKSIHDEITQQSPNNLIPIICNPLSMWLFESTPNEIAHSILKLKNCNAFKDYISTRTCKEHVNILAPTLSKLINNCFENGTFPGELKSSRIVPIFKSGNPLLATNYRPISILPVLSKIFESVFHNRLINFILRSQIINKNQYGFQKQSGTLSAAASIVNMIQTNLDKTKNNSACCVFIDLRKAFDTVPHRLLTDRLQQYGIRGNALSICKEYLQNRKQFVDINETHSETMINDNDFSLPQGSNLGPLFFILFINEIFKLKLNGTLTIYADDATVTYCNADPNQLKQKMQEDLNAIANWFISNKLTPNAEKTHYMLIKPGPHRDYVPNFSLTMCNKNIERVSSFKYLGIIIQDDLKWNEHIDSICKKITGAAYVIKRLGNKIDTGLKKSLYYSMINSHISYCAPVWGTSTTTEDVTRLQVVQNQAIRNIFAFEYHTLNESTNLIMKKHKILNVSNIVYFNKLLIIHKISEGLMKSDFQLDYSRNHDYVTRSNSRPQYMPFRTNTGKNSIFRSCTECYFSIPPSMRNIHSISLFKKICRDMIFDAG